MRTINLVLSAVCVNMVMVSNAAAFALVGRSETEALVSKASRREVRGQMDASALRASPCNPIAHCHRRAGLTLTPTVRHVNFTALSAKSKKEDDGPAQRNPIAEWIQASPGNAIVLPLVIIVGADLLLNIAVITKRSFEYFVLGQTPSVEPWW